MFSSSTSPSLTISRLRQISKSPFSGLMMMSKFSSDPYFLMIMFRKTSSKIAINVSLSTFLNSLNSANDSSKFNCMLTQIVGLTPVVC